jgi:hypothetical protein
MDKYTQAKETPVAATQAQRRAWVRPEVVALPTAATAGPGKGAAGRESPLSSHAGS